MAYTGFSQTNPLDLPRTIDPSASLSELNQLPPPGRPIDATADLHPLRHGNYAAVQHVVTVVLAGSWATNDVATYTVTPVKTGYGVANADAFEAVSFSATTGATQTAAASATLANTAALAAGTISTVAGVGSATRLREIASVSVNGATLTFTGINPGATFTVSASTTGSGTFTVTTVTDAAASNLRVGTFVARDGLAADGKTPKVRALTSSDTLASIWGVVADGNRAVAIDPDSGYTYRSYKPGRDVPILPLEGAFTAYAEAAVDLGDDIWVRTTVSGSEVAGAVNDTPDYTAEVVTLTPTAANTTLYDGEVLVYDIDGTLLASTLYNYTSDGSATAAEIVTGIAADLDAGDVADYLATSGTDDLILTSSGPGYKIVHAPGDGAGVIATVLTTPGACDHLRLKKGKFGSTTSVAGSAIVDFSL